MKANSKLSQQIERRSATSLCLLMYFLSFTCFVSCSSTINSFREGKIFIILVLFSHFANPFISSSLSSILSE